MRWLIAIAALLIAGVVGGVIGNAIAGSGGTTHTVTSASSVAASCDVATIARERLPAVVTIVAGTSGVGSGEVIRSDGYVLTNDHVVAPAGRGGEVLIRFSDGETAHATVTARDPRSDLAVVRISGRSGLETIPIGESSSLDVGQPVVALGAPLGLSSSVTSGIVSGLGRNVRLPAEEGTIALVSDAIQTDAAINPGNSGGALVDCSGKLIGIPTAGATAQSPNGQSSVGNIGLGFAIPVDFAQRVAEELIATGTVTRAYLGLEAQPVAAAGGGSGTRGLLVTGLAAGGPAARAGLREGDVIVEVDGEPAVAVDQLAAVTLTKRPGEDVALTYERAGARGTASVTLGAAP